jgi:hypothetical protein
VKERERGVEIKVGQLPLTEEANSAEAQMNKSIDVVLGSILNGGCTSTARPPEHRDLILISLSPKIRVARFEGERTRERDRERERKERVREKERKRDRER